MEQFKMGDVVQLKSGGPVMTVAELKGGGGVQCLWFTNDQGEHPKGYVFPPECLKKTIRPG